MLLLIITLSASEPALPKTLDQIHLRDPFILPVPEAGNYYLYGKSCHLKDSL